jgi:hypothetical protein
MGARNGSLYLVTGVDKCSNWCVASYAGASDDAGISLHFTATDDTVIGGTSQYSWATSSSVEARTCPARQEGCSVNQCVFIRGYKLAISETLFKKSLVGSVTVSDIHTSKPSVILTQGRNAPGVKKYGGRSTKFFGWGGNNSRAKTIAPMGFKDPPIVESFPPISEV